jgi:hypothetical protein
MRITLRLRVPYNGISSPCAASRTGRNGRRNRRQEIGSLVSSTSVMGACFCLRIGRVFSPVVHDAAGNRSSFMNISLRRCGPLLLACCCTLGLAVQATAQVRAPRAGGILPIVSSDPTATATSGPQARGPRAGALVPVASASEGPAAGVAPASAPCGRKYCAGSRADP